MNYVKIENLKRAKYNHKKIKQDIIDNWQNSGE